ncbi:MAG TPA: tetratricopeptide repeat protein [Ohtaekwangia sp.]|nr:tetratricopeptide repeat protein [Ohtaekwangia sp.]
MKKLFPFVVILFCSSTSIHVFAQTRAIDSLKALLNSTKGDERFDVLDEIIYLSQITDVELAIKCADEAYQLIPELLDSSKIARAYRFKAHFLIGMNRESEALPFLDSALAISCKIDNYYEINFLNNLFGLVYTFQGEYGSALKSFFSATRLLRSDESIRLSNLQNNIGVVFYKLGNNRKAITYFEDALEIRKKEGSHSDTQTLLINIGLAYSQLRDYEQARNYINRGLISCKINCEQIKIQGEFALGLTEFKRGLIVASEPNFKTSLKFSRRMKNNRFIIENLVYLARIYIERGRFDLSKEALQEAEKCSIEHNFNELLLDTYRVFLSMYGKQDNLIELSNYYIRHNALREQLHGRELLQQISVFQVDMEHEANLKTIANQKQVIGLQNDSLRQEQRIYYGISVLIVLIVLIFLLLSGRSVQRKEIKELLEERISQRMEYLERKARQLETIKIDLTENADKRFGVVSRLLDELQDAGTDHPVQYKFQLRSTITQMRFVFDSIEVLQESGKSRKS